MPSSMSAKCVLAYPRIGGHQQDGPQAMTVGYFYSLKYIAMAVTYLRFVRQVVVIWPEEE